MHWLYRNNRYKQINNHFYNNLTTGILTGLLLFLFNVEFVQSQKQIAYQISPSLSSIKFIALHMGFLEVHGSFQKFEGILSNPDNASLFDSLSGTLIIFVESIDTENQLRDKSLRSDSFFQAEKNPFITVNLESIKKFDTDYQADCTVKIMGKSHRLTVPLIVGLSSNDQSIINLNGKFSLSRSELELDFDSPMDSLIGDEIKVIFNMKAIRN